MISERQLKTFLLFLKSIQWLCEISIDHQMLRAHIDSDVQKETVLVAQAIG